MVHSQLPVTPEPPFPVPGPSATPREPFIPAPERYEGDLGRSFLLQCSLVFELQPQTYPTDKSRITYLIGSLRGEALAWAAAVWERGSAVCSDYSAFTEEMRKASQRLLHLRQAESGWKEEALQGVFLSTLSSDIKDQLKSQEESSDLDHLISLTIWVDNRLRERRRERGLHSFSTPSFEPPATPQPSPSFSAPPPASRDCLPSPGRSDARCSRPRRGNAVCARVPVSTVAFQAISGQDVPLFREKNGLASNSRDSSEPLP